ncbi:MAG TPA: STAS domain-containing protein [Intrasporangium sp.]|uniref:STAS domain-containing protein n=1 Tax=Intrasporangium sp. TaxID=1925024 RepID=UPI002D7784FD|nr:STAS domain-containing protein [Intrasporangium sp.]HET7397244.1 STAS domain-containing protein [Intrasporangium sp.]
MTLKRHRGVPVQVLDAPDGHDVIVEGRLDVHTVPDIRDILHDVIGRGPGVLRLHLRNAEIGDATGLGVLVHVHRRASRAERRLLVVDASDRTARLLRGCRLERLLTPRHTGPSGSPEAAGPTDSTVATLTV